MKTTCMPAAQLRIEVGVVVAGGDDQQAVDAALAEEQHQLALALGILVGAARDQELPALARRLLDAARDRGVERVGDVLDHEPEHPEALAAPERARDVVAPEAELLDRLAAPGPPSRA